MLQDFANAVTISLQFNILRFRQYLNKTIIKSILILKIR